MTEYGLVVQNHFPAENVRVATEHGSPEPVAEDDRVRRAWVVFAVREDPPERSPNTERREHVGADGRADDSFRLAGTDQVRPHLPMNSDPLEGGGGLFPVPDIRRRQLHPRVSGRSLPDSDETIRVVKRQRTQQHEIGH